MDLNEDLSILICSANIGNAEPTAESFAAWIPDDGNIIVDSKSSLVDSDGVSALAHNAKYHLIVVGMQEAAFTTKTKKVSDPSIQPDPLNASTRSDAKQDAPVVKKGKLQRKVDKVGLIVRGLTARQNHRTPMMRNKSIFFSQNSNAALSTDFTDLISSSQYDTSKFASLFAERCPSYTLIACEMRGEMRLWVMCLKGLEEEIDEIHVAGENTGIGSVLANKGGIVATLTLRSTRLSFLTCHLEAHEGINHFNNRNKNLIEILGGARPHPDYYMMDATIYSHHMFVCGDLNYRTRFNGEANGKSKRSSIQLLNNSKAGDEDEPDNGSGYSQAMKLIGDEKWADLYAEDELCMALKNKECLVGFETLPCDFSPTFKVAREEGYVYNEKRTPSYTDRILWKSNEGMKASVTPNIYEPCPDFITSDHKPIRGGFTVKLNKNDTTLSPRNEEDAQIHFVVSDIKCRNLPVMDSEMMGGLSDPYVLFVTSPKTLTWQKSWPSTKVIYRELNPTWDEKIHLILNHDGCINSISDLSGDMLYMVIMDYDQTSGDDIIGSVPLSVEDLCSELKFANHDSTSNMHFDSNTGLQKTTISRPVLRNGQEFGTLECTISSAYLEPHQVNSFLKTAGKIRSAKFRNVKDRILSIFK